MLCSKTCYFKIKIYWSINGVITSLEFWFNTSIQMHMFCMFTHEESFTLSGDVTASRVLTIHKNCEILVWSDCNACFFQFLSYSRFAVSKTILLVKYQNFSVPITNISYVSHIGSRIELSDL